MEEDFIHCMLFVTFTIILVVIIVKTFTKSNKLPFNVKRSLKIDLDKDEPIDDLSFNGIPAIIYQTYNNTNVSREIVNIFGENVQNNPEYEFYLLNEADSRLFIKSNFEQKLLNAYDSLDEYDKNNLLIYCIMYRNGGVYMDMNLILPNSLINIITPIFATLETKNNVIFTKNNNLISNKLFIAPPNLPIFKELIDSYMNNQKLNISNLINKYNYKNNIKLYIEGNSIKIIDPVN